MNVPATMHSRMGRINFKFLVILVAGSVCVAAAVHYLHVYQVHKCAALLKQRSNELEKAGNVAGALYSLRKYTDLVPNDVEAIVRVASLLKNFDQNDAARQESFFRYEQAARLEPQREDIRRSAAAAALALGRLTTAKKHVQSVLAKSPGDAHCRFLLGQCLDAEKNLQRAGDEYQTAIESGYQEVEAFLRLASVQERLKQVEQARSTLEEMKTANPESFQAYLATAAYYHNAGDLKQARDDVQRAKELAPDELDVLLLDIGISMATAPGNAAHQAVVAARGRLQAALEKHPTDLRLHQALLDVNLAAKDTEAAIVALRKARLDRPDWQAGKWLLADLLIDRAKIAEAESLFDELSQEPESKLFADYIKARLAMHRDHWAEAVRILEQVSVQAELVPQVALRSRLHLARGYRAMGRLEEELELCRRVVNDFPTSIAAKAELAYALSVLGKPAEAIDVYRRLTFVAGVPMRIAQLMLARNLQLSPKQRDWSKLEQLLEDLAASASDAEVDLLKADILHLQGRTEPAARLLKRLLNEHPENLDVWMSTAKFSIHEEEWPTSERLLRAAGQRFGDRVEIRLAWSLYCLHHIELENRAQRLRALADAPPEYSNAQLRRLWRGLANILARLGETQVAFQLRKQIATLEPYNIRLQFDLYLLARQLKQAEAEQEALTAIENIEGEKGVHFLATKVIRAIGNLRRQRDVKLADQARTHLAEIHLRRPNWEMVPLCRAQLDELNGDFQGAVGNYQRAIQLGYLDLPVLRRTVELLISLGRAAETTDLVRSFQRKAPLNMQGDVHKLAAEVSLHTSNLKQAMDSAKRAVESPGSNARDYVWLGVIAASAESHDEAEKAFRQAIKMAPEDGTAWLAFVRFLAAQKRRDEGVEALQAAADSLPKRVLAFGYAALGKGEEAERAFLSALAEKPEDPGLVRDVAGYYLSISEVVKAERYLRHLLSLAQCPTSSQLWARRNLAAILARRDYPSYLQALDFVEQNIAVAEDPVPDKKLRSRLLSRLPTTESLQQAVELLEELGAQEKLAPVDQLLLASLYDRSGQHAKADAAWTRIYAKHPSEPEYLTAYAQRHLNQGDLEQAWQAVRVLQKVSPDHRQVGPLLAQAHTLQGDANRAAEVIGQGVQSDPAHFTPLRAASLLLELSDLAAAPEQKTLLLEAAEQWANRSSAESGQDEQAAAVQADLLQAEIHSRQGRWAEALDRCERAAAHDVLASAAAAVRISRNHDSDPSQLARVQKMLDDVFAQATDSSQAHFLQAILYDAQGKYNESEASYRAILRQRPKHYAALNNLAFLLTRIGKHNEAEPLIYRAIKISGPRAAPLDTRGLILLNQQQPEAATKDFLEAIQQEDTAVRRLHLAMAFWKSGRRLPATLQLKKARAMGLTEQSLHPHERAALKTLVAQLGKP